jgi:DNA processing protein
VSVSLARAVAMGTVVDSSVSVDEARRAHRLWSGEVIDRRVRVSSSLVARLEALHGALLAGPSVAGVRSCCSHDAYFPGPLNDLDDRPRVIYYCGDQLLLSTIGGDPTAAIVGSRRATPTGREVAYRMARELTAAGIIVVSGMAFGIDAAAHRGALAAGGLTVAVLAGSPGVAHPAAHAALHREIAGAGIVLSEFPPKSRVARWGFPARNRLIAALSRVTVIVEGKERSGALYTTDFATQLGRTVAAVPGSVTSPLSVAPNALLFDGAQLVRGGRDVVELLFGPQHGPLFEPTMATAALEPCLAQVFEAVQAGAVDASAVAGAVEGLSPSKARTALGRLELQGLVRRGEDGEYVAAG